MSASQTIQSIPEETRRAIFVALVEAQDKKLSVSASLEKVAKQYSITRQQVQAIEQEGLDNDWPPLS
jgi:DNA-directed RNA polymerase sigma subunit (sigma70/sigma32)